MENVMLQVGDKVKINNSEYYGGQYGVIKQINEPFKRVRFAGTENNTHIVAIEPRKFEIRFNPQNLEKIDYPVEHDYSEIEKEKEEIFKVGNIINWLDDDNEIAIAAEVKEVIEIEPHVYEYVLSVFKFANDPPPPHKYPIIMRERSSSFGKFRNNLPIVVGKE
jgi:hypothetical protein